MTDPPSVLKVLLSSLWLSSWIHPNVPGINGKLKCFTCYWPAAFWCSSVQFTWISKILKSTEKIRMRAFYLSAPTSEVYAVIRTCICWPICLNTNKKAPHMIFTSISQSQGELLLTALSLLPAFVILKILMGLKCLKRTTTKKQNKKKLQLFCKN